jgi:hypothetical protein
LAHPVKRDGRRIRPFNPHAPDDAKLSEAISRGEFTINGFRNRDLRRSLFADADASKPEQRRLPGVVSPVGAVARAPADQKSPWHSPLPPHQTRSGHCHG